MTIQEMAELIAKTPEGLKMGDKSYWATVISSVMPSAVDEIAMAHDWDFVFDEQTKTVTRGVSEYAIEGNNSNLREIVNISYGPGNNVLQKYRALDALDFLDSDVAPSGVTGYYVKEINKSGYPVVKLIGTPGEGTTMTVRFRRKITSFAEFPPEFGALFIAYILGTLYDSWYARYLGRLRTFVRRYKAGAKDYNPVQIDPARVAGNRRRANLYGLG